MKKPSMTFVILLFVNAPFALQIQPYRNHTTTQMDPGYWPLKQSLQAPLFFQSDRKMQNFMHQVQEESSIGNQTLRG